jgi:hypothetical protein
MVSMSESMDLEARREMIRERMAPLIISLMTNTSIEYAFERHKHLLTMLMYKFHEFALVDAEHADIYNTVIWFVSKPFWTMSRLETPLLAKW